MSEIYKGFNPLLVRSTLILTSYFVQVDLISRNTNLMDSKVGQFMASGAAAMFSYWMVWPFEVLKNIA